MGTGLSLGVIEYGSRRVGARERIRVTNAV